MAASARRLSVAPRRDAARRALMPRGRLPRAAWICALVGTLNAIAWGVLVPAFQVPDEQSHYAYTEYLVQHGKPPATARADRYSSSESAALAGLKFREMRFAGEDGAIWSTAERRRMDELLAQDGDRASGNGAGREVGGEPPLFYALQAIPYGLGSAGDVLDRLALMRLLSALMAGATVLFVYLFVREALPGTPEAWSVGALGVAFAPMFNFFGGGMNSDSLLYAASAALFYLFARAFRRGLGAGLAVAIGAALAVGLMTKFNALGLVPGSALALLVLGLRERRAARARPFALPALALGVALAPVLGEMALNATVWDRPLVGATSSAYFGASALKGTQVSGLSYLWQFYAVPLPGMRHYLGGFPLVDLWVRGFVGWFGWIDTHYRQWVYDVALVPLAAIVLLAARAVALARRRARARWGELLSYAAIAGGMMAFVAIASYITYLRYGDSIAHIRYLFPLLALYGLLLALAARGAGRRWAPVLGTAIVVLAIGHDVFSQLLVVARYYA